MPRMISLEAGGSERAILDPDVIRSQIFVPKEEFLIDCEEYLGRADEFLKREMERRKSEGLMVGLSGGIDSGVAAAMLARSGKNVTLVTVKAKGYIRQIDIDDAIQVAEKLKMPHEIIDLAKVFSSVTPMRLPGMAHILMGIRNTIIKELAEQRKYLLVGTGNKTELMSGLYCSNSLLGQVFPMLSLYKTQVYNLAKHLDLPECILTKKSHSGIEGSEDDLFLGVGYEDFDAAAYAFHHHAGLIPVDVKSKIHRNYRNADIFLDFPGM